MPQQLGLADAVPRDDALVEAHGPRLVGPRLGLVTLNASPETA
jgi:hypothetical protein